MENVSYTIDEKKSRKAIRKAYKKQTFKRKIKKVGEWFVDNKDVVLIIGPSLIGVAAGVARFITGAVKTGARRMNIRAEEKVKDCYCYDRSLGHYWRLRRKLTNKEWTEIDKRKMNGERMADILNDLHVLK